MTDKHTPEPWALCYSGSHIFIVDANYNAIASLDFDSKTKEANAALIARAPELLAENEALKARIAELEAERTWQPIETAPRDLTEVLLYHPKGGVVSGFFDSRWRRSGKITDEMPTHWMPMPKKEDEQ